RLDQVERALRPPATLFRSGFKILSHRLFDPVPKYSTWAFLMWQYVGGPVDARLLSDIQRARCGDKAPLSHSASKPVQYRVPARPAACAWSYAAQRQLRPR